MGLAHVQEGRRPMAGVGSSRHRQWPLQRSQMRPLCLFIGIAVGMFVVARNTPSLPLPSLGGGRPGQRPAVSASGLAASLAVLGATGAKGGEGSGFTPTHAQAAAGQGGTGEPAAREGTQADHVPQSGGERGTSRGQKEEQDAVSINRKWLASRLKRSSDPQGVSKNVSSLPKAAVKERQVPAHSAEAPSQPVEPAPVVQPAAHPLTGGPSNELGLADLIAQIEAPAEGHDVDVKELAWVTDPEVVRTLSAALAPPPALVKRQVVKLQVDEMLLVGGCQSDMVLALTTTQLLHLNQSQNDSCPIHYTKDMLRMLLLLPREYHHRTFLVRFSDSTIPLPYPVLSKAHVIGDESLVLLPLNMDNHMGPDFLWAVQGGDAQPFLDKTPTAVWRGSSTGSCYDPTGANYDCPPELSPDNPRRELVMRWGRNVSERVDVGFNQLVQERDKWADVYGPFVKPGVSLQELLKHRYLISVEGNDVATGLKWMLASNSVVFMPPPRFESWAMESLLKPWAHYVPIRRDTRDLLERIEECDQDPARCEAISQRATEFIRFYHDQNLTWALGAERVKAYLDHIEIVVPAVSNKQ